MKQLVLAGRKLLYERRRRKKLHDIVEAKAVPVGVNLAAVGLENLNLGLLVLLIANWGGRMHVRGRHPHAKGACGA